MDERVQAVNPAGTGLCTHRPRPGPEAHKDRGTRTCVIDETTGVLIAGHPARTREVVEVGVGCHLGMRTSCRLLTAMATGMEVEVVPVRPLLLHRRGMRPVRSIAEDTIARRSLSARYLVRPWGRVQASATVIKGPECKGTSATATTTIDNHKARRTDPTIPPDLRSLDTNTLKRPLLSVAANEASPDSRPKRTIPCRQTKRRMRGE